MRSLPQASVDWRIHWAPGQRHRKCSGLAVLHLALSSKQQPQRVRECRHDPSPRSLLPPRSGCTGCDRPRFQKQTPSTCVLCLPTWYTHRYLWEWAGSSSTLGRSRCHQGTELWAVSLASPHSDIHCRCDKARWQWAAAIRAGSSELWMSGRGKEE